MEKAAARHVQAIKNGLMMIGRDRKVVLSHHHTFDLIQKMQEHLTQLERHITDPGQSPAGQSPAGKNSGRRKTS